MPARPQTIIAVSMFAFLVCVLAVGSIIYFLGPREPTHEGKSLDTWIEPFCSQTKTGLDAPGGPAKYEQLQPVRRAVTAMGTNALPFLIARLTNRESPIHKKARHLLDKQPVLLLRLDDPRVEYIRAIRALAILGPNANPAVSNLVGQLGDPLLSPHVVYALQAIGEDGMRALVRETTNNHSTQIRMEIANAFLTYGTGVYLKTNTSSASIVAAGLTQIAQDSSFFFRGPAIHRLGMFGTAASNAVPVLTNCLTDPDISVRMAAASTLQRLGYVVDFPSLMPGHQVPRTPFATPVTNFFRPSGRPMVLPP